MMFPIFLSVISRKLIVLKHIDTISECLLCPYADIVSICFDINFRPPQQEILVFFHQLLECLSNVNDFIFIGNRLNMQLTSSASLHDILFLGCSIGAGICIA